MRQSFRLFYWKTFKWLRSKKTFVKRAIVKKLPPLCHWVEKRRDGNAYFNKSCRPNWDNDFMTLKPFFSQHRKSSSHCGDYKIRHFFPPYYCVTRYTSKKAQKDPSRVDAVFNCYSWDNLLPSCDYLTFIWALFPEILVFTPWEGLLAYSQPCQIKQKFCWKERGQSSLLKFSRFSHEFLQSKSGTNSLWTLSLKLRKLLLSVLLIFLNYVGTPRSA